MKHFRKAAVIVLAIIMTLTAAIPAAAAGCSTDGCYPTITICSPDQLCELQDTDSIYNKLCALMEQLGCQCAGAIPSVQLPTEAVTIPTEPAVIPTQPPAEAPTEVPAMAPLPTEAPTQKTELSTVPEPTVPEPTSAPDQAAEPFTLSAYEQEVITLTNRYRAQYGLSPLTADETLCGLARMKSQDMHDMGYFDHTSPTYGTPFEMMKRFGVSYRAAGENIAMGYRTAASVVEGWMNSPGHRANILNADFTKIGVGYVADGSYCTQLFIG